MGGKRCMGLGLLLLPAALLAASAAWGEDQPPEVAQATPPPLMLVLDASRGMWARLGGESKMGILRSALGREIGAYAGKIRFGAAMFGHRAAPACTESELLAKPGELTSDTQKKLLFRLKPQSSRPVAAALTEAAKGVPADAASFDMLLVSDGPDSCKADLCSTAKTLKEWMPAMRIHVIGFHPKGKAAVKPLECVAANSGGEFLVAKNATELKQSLTAVLDKVAEARPEQNPAPTAQSGATTASVEPSATTAETETATDQSAAEDVPPLPTPAPKSAASLAEAAGPSEAAPATGALPQSPSPPEPPADAPAPAGDAQAVQAPAEIVGPQRPAETTVVKRSAHATESAVPPHSPPPSAPAPAPSVPVPVTFKALLTESGPNVDSGLVWRVFSTEPDLDGARKLVSLHREAVPTAALSPGEYLVNAAYGLSNLTKKIKVESGRSLEETFVLNTGGLRLGAVLADSQPIPATSVRFDIFSDEQDQFGNARKILMDAKPGVVIRLNAGAYDIVSTYGDANAIVRADVTVEPGKITEATVKHAAAPITFRLVQSAGGEALADTRWKILTTTGDVVKQSAGALPTHILAAGDYAVIADHAGLSFTNRFQVAAGEARQVEVVMEQGPASAEALKAITAPPAPLPAPPPGVEPSGGESGMAFGASPDTGSSREPGFFPNPGALLRPSIPGPP